MNPLFGDDGTNVPKKSTVTDKKEYVLGRSCA